MVGTLNQCVVYLVVAKGEGWDTAVSLVMLEYCCRPARGGPSPFQFLYKIKPKMIADDGIGFDDNTLSLDQIPRLKSLILNIVKMHGNNFKLVVSH